MKRSAIKLIIVAVLVVLAWQYFGAQAQANIQLDTLRLTLRSIDPLLVLIIGGVGGYVVRSLGRG